MQSIDNDTCLHIGTSSTWTAVGIGAIDDTVDDGACTYVAVAARAPDDASAEATPSAQVYLRPPRACTLHGPLLRTEWPLLVGDIDGLEDKILLSSYILRLFYQCACANKIKKWLRSRHHAW
jgi:hypothetical protein